MREVDFQLPAQGWGTLTLARTLPATAKKWTDHGRRHDPAVASTPGPSTLPPPALDQVADIVGQVLSSARR